jgi:hypothetical protein
VLVRTRSEFACQLYCLNTLRRIVWDGDQILYEISAPGGSSDMPTQMEADTALAVTFFLNQQQTAVTGFFPFGRVMYEPRRRHRRAAGRGAHGVQQRAPRRAGNRPPQRLARHL